MLRTATVDRVSSPGQGLFIIFFGGGVYIAWYYGAPAPKARVAKPAKTKEIQDVGRCRDCGGGTVGIRAREVRQRFH